MVPKTGTRRVYLKMRSQTQKASTAVRLRSMRNVVAGPWRRAKSLPKASLPAATSSGSKARSSARLRMRRPKMQIVSVVMTSDMQKNGFLRTIAPRSNNVQCASVGQQKTGTASRCTRPC